MMYYLNNKNEKVNTSLKGKGSKMTLHNIMLNEWYDVH